VAAARHLVVQTHVVCMCQMCKVNCLQKRIQNISFDNFCRAMLCISAAYAVMRCLFVHPSVTFVYHVKTNKHIFEMFSPLGSHTILVFLYQTGWRYSDGTPRNRGIKCRLGRQKTQLWTNIWLRCIQVYSVVNRTSVEV